MTTGLYESVFLEKEFFLLVIFSLLFPALIYGTMWLRRAISRSTVLVFGFMPIILSGMDLYLLQILSGMAKHSSSMLDDKIFSSEISIALYLYLLPALFAGTGINVLSHILINHLVEAESRFDNRHPNRIFDSVLFVSRNLQNCSGRLQSRHTAVTGLG